MYCASWRHRSQKPNRILILSSLRFPVFFSYSSKTVLCRSFAQGSSRCWDNCSNPGKIGASSLASHIPLVKVPGFSKGLEMFGDRLYLFIYSVHLTFESRSTEIFIVSCVVPLLGPWQYLIHGLSVFCSHLRILASIFKALLWNLEMHGFYRDWNVRNSIVGWKLEFLRLEDWEGHGREAVGGILQCLLFRVKCLWRPYILIWNV